MRKGHRDHYNVWWGEEENKMVQVTEVAQPMTTCFNTLISCEDPEIFRRSFQGIGESKSPFPAPPFNKSMQEHIQIIMHEAVSPLQPTDSVIKQFITMHLKWFQMLTIVQCKCDKCTLRNGTLLQRFDRRLNLTLIPHLRLLV